MIHGIGEVAIIHPQISINSEQLKRRLGKVKRPEHFSPHVEKVLEEASSLWAPRICWARYSLDTSGAAAGTVAVAGRDGMVAGRLEVGPRADLLIGALECFIAVGTVGGAITERIRALDETGDVMSAYLMDIAGVLALDVAHQQFRNEIEAYAGSRNWGIGPIMQPGSLEGWPITGQSDLLRLLPIEEIGVTLNRFFMMEPPKSNSSLVGLGPGYGKARAECLCEDCERYECPWRRSRSYDYVS